jgi:hypothetical protein
MTRMHHRSPEAARTAFTFTLILTLALPLLAAVPAGADDLTVCKAPASLAAARAEARRLVAEIRTELAPVEDEIRNVPFVSELEAGHVTLDQLADFLGEQYNIIKSDQGSFSFMVTRFDDPASREMFGGIAGGETIALDLLLDFAERLGRTEADLLAYEPKPKGQTYPSRVAWISLFADRATAGASFLVNFAVFGENMGRVQQALIDVYGFTAEETAFFGFFAEPIPGFEENAIDVIAAGLRRGACPREVKRSARLLQSYELDFWQAVGE